MTTIHIAVWDDDGTPNAQAYGNAAAARRDFPEATIIESTLQEFPPQFVLTTEDADLIANAHERGLDSAARDIRDAITDGLSMLAEAIKR